MVLVWTAVQQQLVCTLQNWNLQRPYPPLHSRRTQGFTEDWGIEEDDDEDETENEKTSEDVAIADDIKNNPPNRLHIVQFRPAWMEQLALLVAEIDFTVHNSRYPVTERTGPLPYLQSFDDGDEDGTVQPPVLVGRYQSHVGHGGNAIFAYLQKYYPHQTASLFETTASQRHTATAMESVIRDRLATCLAVIRYHSTPDTWEQVHRPLLSRASILPWAAYAERIWHRRSHTTTRMSLDQAITTAQQAYALLEHQLQPEDATSTSCYLLGTPTPTYLDCELVDHLLQAIVDPQLGPLMGGVLTRYLQHMWHTYLAADPALVRKHRSNIFCQSLWTTTPFGDDILVLSNASVVEQPQPIQPSLQSRPDPWATWHFWTRGAEPSKHQRDNELWIATVVSGTLVSMWWMGWAASS